MDDAEAVRLVLAGDGSAALLGLAASACMILATGSVLLTSAKSPPVPGARHPAPGG